ncbi:Pol Polyprotein [Phytophthora megakarya]|uniref:Pol Polyprotein n=1 Tax=Phytophthora megakarya TaxID=4795 RepID=A0A225WNY1_9STRA|nr:Pol Polyprotein [Phytophthora megakarya]
MTASDFFWAIKTTAKGKSSGLDGLPAEYYQIFSHKWVRVYELIYASQFNKGRMTKFQRRAYISLLYKKRDRSLPSNYRPLTLLNHDAKFGPKIVAYRLRNILPKLLHSDQFGFTQGRSIRHALVEFQDLQQLAKNSGLNNAGAVLLDFDKAFDSVLWPALNLVLKHFGFGKNFQRCNHDFLLVTVLVNGIASEYFELGCGVRQGDPLSPALFVLFLEPMLNFLRWKTGHLGINVPNSKHPHHLLAFADDCTGILRNLRHTWVFIDSVQY